MKKLFLLSALASVLAFSSASAQNRKDPAMNGSKLGIGVDFALPTGNYGDLYKLGVGGSLTYIAPIADNLKFTANAGYLNFSGKDVLGIKVPSAAYIPVKAGIRYYFVENFYAGGELGAAFGTKGLGTRFAYSPGIGVEFPVADKASIDLGVRYEAWSKGDYFVTPSFFGIRAAVNFGL